MGRAIERGEVDPDVDVEAVALVAPSITSFRLVLQRQPVDVILLARLIDAVVLPALGLTDPAAGRSPGPRPVPTGA